MKPTFRHFSELNEENIDFDFHVHTEITDGTESPERMIEAAVRKGLKEIAFTEHVTRETNWYNSFADRIFHLRKKSPNIIVYLGAETKAIDFQGNTDIPESIVGLPELLVGSVHRYPDGTNGFLSFNEIIKLGQDRASEMEFELTLALIHNRDNGVDVIGHPFGVFSKLYESFPINLYEMMLVESLKHEKAIEINTSYLKDANALMLLKRIDPCISLGSDAHNAQEIVQSYDLVKGFVRR